MNRLSSLLAGAAPYAVAACAFAAPLSAQTATDPSATLATDASATATAPGTDGAGGDIVVLGFGQSRQVQSVSAADIARLTPGSSPLKAIEKLPGVNLQASDPFGAYEWAVRISLRGFNQNQLGFTLDGVPLGDMSYGNVNGLHISRAIISENVARTDVAQGAGALGTASTSNLGGTIEFFSDKPRDVMNVTGGGTYGSDNTYRAFARVDSGDLGGGLKGYLSYGFLSTDKWKGDGVQRQHQANGKIVKDLGSLGSLTAFLNFSDRREQDYQDLSLDIIRRRGLRNDNIADNYPLALQIAKVAQNQAAVAGGTAQPWAGVGTTFPAGFGTVDDAYYDAGGLRRDYLGGVTFDANLTPELTLTTTGYYHDNKGQGSWITPYSPTPAGAANADGTPITAASPLGFRTTEYAMKRGGALTNLAYVHGANTLELGGWYETNTFTQARRFYGMTDSATPNRDTLEFQSNPYATQWDGKYTTDTIQYHVGDTIRLADDRLVLNAGWKGFYVTNRAIMLPATASPLAVGKISAKDWFQPQAGILFKLTPGAELFADYKENVRAYVSSATTGPFSTTQAGFDAIRGQLKPERSKTAEGGLRFREGPFQASAVGYYIDFSNRLLGFSNGAGIIGNPATLNNVGSVHTYGAEVAVNYRIFTPLSLFASYSYNKSKYADDVLSASGAVLVATDGKMAVDSPEHMLKGEIVVEQSGFTGRVGADYMSKRYFTYLNDQSVPGRVLVDASIGYRFEGEGALHGVSILGSVTNLTDKKYISTVGTNGFTASGDNQTLLAGTPRQVFISLKKGF
ncbi:iron complex outermembrane receptor protein [Sphingomonas sp. PP-F2F-G114-C0414]|uniref:TonB-dependent receptor n=1 Tax=Sphingomonas sp. PP-F2F-G114-C0414 TaxID=2135662 RepID=UPI000F29A3CF|nr:TonB-dependent receptor [Sphingomonas sp. PP-F2F-G114-C0414]RMB35822.1 iron complex outermembrane receptor protein [Sphingomonas sp. PP-F2F-G114-C0414]